MYYLISEQECLSDIKRESMPRYANKASKITVLYPSYEFFYEKILKIRV